MPESNPASQPPAPVYNSVQPAGVVAANPAGGTAPATGTLDSKLSA